MEEPMTTENKVPKKYGKFEDYEVENWADNIVRTNEIMNDKDKLAAVQQCLKIRLVATQEAARQVGIEEKVGKKLKEVFGAEE